MFSNVTVRTFSEALLQLHRYGTRDDFACRIFACLKTCFVGDFFSCNVRTENQDDRIELYPASGVDLDVLSGWITQRPNLRGLYKHSSYPRILRFWAPFHRGCTELHDELLVLLGQRHKLKMVVFDEHCQINVVVSRFAQSFSGEEWQMLELLRPHIGQAYKSGNQSSFLSEAIGAANVGFIVTDRRGKICHATVKARRLLTQYFDPTSDLTLPDRIRSWLHQRANVAGISAVQDLTIDLGHMSLTVQIVSNADAPQCRLLLRETVQTLDLKPLQKLGLTGREAEVLFWASQGKSNGEIAIILASNVRTIGKHLQRIFAKLMVENRTAATRAALAAVNHLSA